MISEKRFGAIPTGAPDMTPAELAAHAVEMQNQRAELVVRLDELRQVRDTVKESIGAMRAQLEAKARTELPPARGKTEPSAAAIKSYVDRQEGIVSLKREAEQAARDLAAVQDQHDATRSALRVLGSLIQIKLLEGAEPGVTADVVAGDDW